MKRILSLLFIAFAFILVSNAQSIVTINQYNVPYSVFGDSIKNDTQTVIVDFRLGEKFDLVTHAYGVSTDTISADIDVTKSFVNIANSYDTFFSFDSLYSANTVSSKDTVNYNKFLKFTINGSDTALYYINVMALPIK